MSPHQSDKLGAISCQETSKLETLIPQAKALVFDCDGTLLDTMPIYYESWKRTCDEVGLSFSMERFYSTAGMPVIDIFRLIIEEQDKTDILCPNECENKKKQHHADVEAEGRVAGPIDVVVDFALKHHGSIPMAVASSGWRDHVLNGLKRVGILKLFDAVVTADEAEVEKGKPHPDIFLVAAKRLGVSPRACIGFEDADLGIQAVNSAGYLSAVDVRLLTMYPRNVEKRQSAERGTA
jgi:HAD superfamily hydrolase (TIGR01509 family)